MSHPVSQRKVRWCSLVLLALCLAGVLRSDDPPSPQDSDGDGLPDEWELTYGFDPADPVDGQYFIDLDQDSLGNLQEYQAGTHPFMTDTDGDTLPDGWEVTYQLNPVLDTDANSDNDVDGMTALLEYAYSTNPNAADTDGDGVGDWLEIMGGGDPTNPAVVMWLGYRTRDYDLDGMPDEWETEHGLNAMSAADKWSDADGDGLPNLMEYAWGRDPGNSGDWSDQDGDWLADDGEAWWGESAFGMPGIWEGFHDPAAVLPGPTGLPGWLELMAACRGWVESDYYVSPPTVIWDANGDGIADLTQDLDNDGLPAWWERLRGLDPAVRDNPAEDPDHNGLTLLQEYQRTDSPWYFAAPDLVQQAQDAGVAIPAAVLQEMSNLGVDPVDNAPPSVITSDILLESRLVEVYRVTPGFPAPLWNPEGTTYRYLYSEDILWDWLQGLPMEQRISFTEDFTVPFHGRSPSFWDDNTGIYLFQPIIEGEVVRTILTDFRSAYSTNEFLRDTLVALKRTPYPAVWSTNLPVLAPPTITRPDLPTYDADTNRLGDRPACTARKIKCRLWPPATWPQGAAAVSVPVTWSNAVDGSVTTDYLIFPRDEFTGPRVFEFVPGTSPTTPGPVHGDTMTRSASSTSVPHSGSLMVGEPFYVSRALGQLVTRMRENGETSIAKGLGFGKHHTKAVDLSEESDFDWDGIPDALDEFPDDHYNGQPPTPELEGRLCEVEQESPGLMNFQPVHNGVTNLTTYLVGEYFYSSVYEDIGESDEFSGFSHVAFDVNGSVTNSYSSSHDKHVYKWKSPPETIETGGTNDGWLIQTPVQNAQPVSADHWKLYYSYDEQPDGEGSWHEEAWLTSPFNETNLMRMVHDKVQLEVTNSIWQGFDWWRELLPDRPLIPSVTQRRPAMKYKGPHTESRPSFESFALEYRVVWFPTTQTVAFSWLIECALADANGSGGTKFIPMKFQSDRDGGGRPAPDSMLGEHALAGAIYRLAPDLVDGEDPQSYTPATARNMTPNQPGTYGLLLPDSLHVWWVACSNNTLLFPNLNTNGGLGIYPDATNPTDTVARNQVELHIFGETNATVHLRIFDVDDPTPPEFDEQPLGTPVVDIHGPTGNDNFGGAGGGSIPASVQLNSNGFATVTVQTTMQPGDNWRVAAAYQADLAALNNLNIDSPGSPNFVPSGNAQIPGFTGTVSEMLTVWRRLWLEIDSMEAVATTGDEKNFVEAVVQRIGQTSAAGSDLRFDKVIGRQQNELERGKADLEGENTHLEIHENRNGSYEDVVTVMASLTSNVVGRICRLTDDDDKHLAELNLGPALPRNGAHAHVVSGIQGTFAPGYIKILDYNATGSNHHQLVPFKRNLGSDNSFWESGSDIPRSKMACWTWRLIFGYQPMHSEDYDPDNEAPTLGETPAEFLVLGAERYGYSVIYVEVIRDTALGSYNIPFATSLYWDWMLGVCAHEMGHGPSNSIPSSNHDEMGLMQEGGDKLSGSQGVFSSKTIRRFRERNKWDK